MTITKPASARHRITIQIPFVKPGKPCVFRASPGNALAVAAGGSVVELFPCIIP